MKIQIHYLLRNFDMIYVEVSKNFTDYLREKIIQDYGSIKAYNRKVSRINYVTFKWAFQRKKYHNYNRLLKIANSLDIPEEDVSKEIKGFYHWGSHRKQGLKIPKNIALNDFFVEGYALYLAEGDTGFNGKKKPRKLRFTNSELCVIKHYMNWLDNFFTDCPYSVNVVFPENMKLSEECKKKIIKKLSLNKEKVRFSRGYHNKQIKYRVCLDQAIIIDLVLTLEETIKEATKNNEKLAAAYVRGMMIGEGTAYCNRSKYVRIEMKNQKEIDFISELLDILAIQYKKKCRSNREGMWSLYIGGRENIKRYSRVIGFGVHKKRQDILDKIVNTEKKLGILPKQ
ncbi:hypothetical protein GF345_00620 [Candidatus Woesearchaeota archaeon]|nr:hypothetical protein [Candidatus Woesearchaeota archaeon]